MKYQINPSATLLKKQAGDTSVVVRFLMDSSRMLHEFQISLEGVDVLKRLYEPMDERDLCDEFDVSHGELIEFFGPLLKNGLILRESDFLDSGSYGPSHVRTVEFFRTFSHSHRSSSEMMNSLLASSVLILGLGGIGTWVAESLVRTGIRKLTLIDPDVVERSNISRQAVFRLSDIGEYKADVMFKFCEDINAEARVNVVKRPILESTDLAEHLEGISLVINCADKPDVDTTNGLVSTACYKRRIPHILCGGYDGHLSSLGQTVIPGLTSCWFCYADSGIHDSMLEGFEIVERESSDNVGGTISPVASMVASLQSQEAIRILTGCAQPLLANTRAELSFSSLSIHSIPVPRLENCRLCSK